MNLTQYENFFAEHKALISLLESKKNDLEAKITRMCSTGQNLVSALSVMNAVSVLCQDQFKSVVEGIVTDAIRFVYGDEYSFEMDSEVKRSQPETHFFVLIGGRRYSIRNDDIGGGVIDVVSFALRVVLWALQDQQTNNVMVLDEPLKNVDSDRLVLVSSMIHKLSQDLNLQFIMVTHETQLAEAADVSWLVSKSRGVSTVKRITQ